MIEDKREPYDNEPDPIEEAEAWLKRNFPGQLNGAVYTGVGETPGAEMWTARDIIEGLLDVVEVETYGRRQFYQREKGDVMNYHYQHQCICGGSFDEYNLCFECDKPRPTQQKNKNATGRQHIESSVGVDKLR